MVCKSTGEINYNCVGVGRSTKTSRRRFLKRICPKTNLPSKAKYPPAQPLFEDYCSATTAQLLSEPQRSCQTLSETFQILPEPSNLMRAQPCCQCSYFRSALWNLSIPRSNLPEPQNRRTFAKPNISGALQYLQNAPQLFLIQLSWATFLSNIFDCMGWATVISAIIPMLGGWLHSRFYSYCRGWLRKLVGYLVAVKYGGHL